MADVAFNVLEFTKVVSHKLQKYFDGSSMVSCWEGLNLNNNGTDIQVIFVKLLISSLFTYLLPVEQYGESNSNHRAIKISLILNCVNDCLNKLHTPQQPFAQDFWTVVTTIQQEIRIISKITVPLTTPRIFIACLVLNLLSEKSDITGSAIIQKLKRELLFQCLLVERPHADYLEAADRQRSLQVRGFGWFDQRGAIISNINAVVSNVEDRLNAELYYDGSEVLLPGKVDQHAEVVKAIHDLAAKEETPPRNTVAGTSATKSSVCAVQRQYAEWMRLIRKERVSLSGLLICAEHIRGAETKAQYKTDSTLLAVSPTENVEVICADAVAWLEYNAQKSARKTKSSRKPSLYTSALCGWSVDENCSTGSASGSDFHPLPAAVTNTRKKHSKHSDESVPKSSRFVSRWRALTGQVLVTSASRPHSLHQSVFPALFKRIATSVEMLIDNRFAQSSDAADCLLYEEEHLDIVLPAMDFFVTLLAHGSSLLIRSTDTVAFWAAQLLSLVEATLKRLVGDVPSSISQAPVAEPVPRTLLSSLCSGLLYVAIHRADVLLVAPVAMTAAVASNTDDANVFQSQFLSLLGEHLSIVLRHCHPSLVVTYLLFLAPNIADDRATVHYEIHSPSDFISPEVVGQLCAQGSGGWAVDLSATHLQHYCSSIEREVFGACLVQWTPRTVHCDVPNIHTVTAQDYWALYSRCFLMLFPSYAAQQERQRQEREEQEERVHKRRRLLLGASDGINIFERVPVELSLAILSYFSHKRVCRFSCVSSLFRELTSHHTLWEGLYKAKFRKYCFIPSSSGSHNSCGSKQCGCGPLLNRNKDSALQAVALCNSCMGRPTKIRKCCEGNSGIKHNWYFLFKERVLKLQGITTKQAKSKLCNFVGCCIIVRKGKEEVHYLKHVKVKIKAK